VSKVRILNAFSLNMLPEGWQGLVHYHRLELHEVMSLVRVPRHDADGKTYWIVAPDMEWDVGHDDTARVFSHLLGLGRELPANRATVTLEDRGVAGQADIVNVIGQYVGPRLPVGATQLPEGARVDWFSVWVEVTGEKKPKRV
jgi:hypothetical protein